MDLFERQWQVYRAVVDNDWMEHRGLTSVCAAALRTWVGEHPGRRGEIRLLDLGCGDLARMGPVFRELPLKTYVGVDLAEPVLPAARAALGRAPFTAEFHRADIVEFVAAPGETVDLVHASLVVHHLADPDKQPFLAPLRRRVSDGGAFVWADLFREPGESRAEYLTRYTARIRGSWHAIDKEAREAIVSHITAFDFPADREAIVEVAEAAGWQWRWLWQGSHQAEAVALLTAGEPERGVTVGGGVAPDRLMARAGRCASRRHR